MPILKGMSWDHPRGFDPMVATAEEFTKNNPDYEIVWEKRSLQAFADRPIEQMAFDYDLMIIDHPHVGEASRKGLLIELDNYDQYKKNLEILTKQSVGISHKSYEFSNNQYALAIDAATPVSAFREDLIDDIPRTYEDVIRLAENKKVMWPIKPVDSISSFNSIAANIGSPINEKEKSFLDKNIAISILKMMKKLFTVTVIGIIDATQVDQLLKFERGVVAQRAHDVVVIGSLHYESEFTNRLGQALNAIAQRLFQRGLQGGKLLGHVRPCARWCWCDGSWPAAG